MAKSPVKAAKHNLVPTKSAASPLPGVSKKLDASAKAAQKRPTKKG